MSDDEDPLDDLVPDDDDEASARDDVPVSENGDPPDDGDAPLDDLVERARQGQGAVDDDPMEAFEEVDVEQVDVDELWQRLETEQVEPMVDDPERDGERDVRVVDKREYCMRCQYFSAPPEVRCGHERGEILEVVDTGSFRVAGCPILAGEEELENLRR